MLDSQQLTVTYLFLLMSVLPPYSPCWGPLHSPQFVQLSPHSTIPCGWECTRSRQHRATDPHLQWSKSARTISVQCCLWWCLSVPHHAAADCGAAQGVVLSEACSTKLKREDVWDRGLTDQGVKERLQCLIRLEKETGNIANATKENTEWTVYYILGKGKITCISFQQTGEIY